jgi:hypothetical protein
MKAKHSKILSSIIVGFSIVTSSAVHSQQQSFERARYDCEREVASMYPPPERVQQRMERTDRTNCTTRGDQIECRTTQGQERPAPGWANAMPALQNYANNVAYERKIQEAMSSCLTAKGH